MPTPFADRLAEAVRTKQSALVVGLDPQLEKLPLELRRAADAGAADARERAAAALRAFDAAVIELVAPFAVAVKPQSAFYERWGAPGVAAYEHAVERARAADLRVDGRPLHEHVAELVARWGAKQLGACGYSSVGAVVGATAPDELRRLRA